MSTRIDVSQLSGQDGFVIVARSRANTDRLFVSTPHSLELTEKQAINLANAIIDQAERIWND